MNSGRNFKYWLRTSEDEISSSSWREEMHASRSVAGVLRHFPLLLAGLLLTSLLASLTEGAGAGAIIALLQSPGQSLTNLGNLSLPADLTQWIASLSLLERVRIGALALLAIVLVRGVFQYISQLISVWLQIRVDRLMRSEIYAQIIALEMRYIHKEKTGNLFALLNAYPRRVASLVQSVTSGVINIFTILIYAALMLLVSWQLTLLALLLLAGVATILRRRFAQAIRTVARRLNRATKALHSVGIESISGLKLIHLHSQEQTSLERYGESLNDYQQQQFQIGKLLSLNRPLFSVVNTVALCLLLFAASIFLPAQTETWLGVMAIFLVITFRLLAPATAINDSRAQITSLYPALQEMQEFIDPAGKPFLKSGKLSIETIRTAVTLDNVTFQYDPEEAPVLEEVTFNIPQGKMTAVVGPSGAGKSTLVNLVARLYDPTSGAIRVDGVDLRELDLENWHSKIAVVSQDTFIFNDSVLANLKFANPAATDEQVQEATRLANADEFIQSLPQGYQTLLGDRGVRLSGGQQQRVAIARAILANPQLLILDEATSHLDTQAERSIQESLDKLSQRCTTLVIAHRLSTIYHADQIIVLKESRLVEQGTHAQLMEKRGQYWRLVQVQSLEDTGLNGEPPVG